MASEVLGCWSRSKFHMQLNHASAKREPKFFDIMTSEPHQNIGGGGGSMISEHHQNIWGGGQWYPRSNTNSGGSIISEPPKISGGGAPWCYPSPHQKQLGEGGWWYLSPTNLWGALNDIRVPPKIWGSQWYPRSTKYIGGGVNDI